ncbi:MAG: GNAT family N-acetyltransferase [Flavobacteriales bacterium]|nr:GNAT family N-acetyltransferase [Flavobacteriales bacterium]
MRLVGEKTILRAPNIKDSELILGWENSEDTVRVSSHYGGYQQSDIEEYIRGIKDVYLDKQLRFIICSGEKAIGTIDLFDVDFDLGVASVGLLIAEQEHRNQGRGSESISLLVEYCTETLSLECLNAQILIDNLVSISFFKKMGFKEISSDGRIVLMQLELRK